MSAGTKQRAPTIDSAPTTARSITTAFIPTSAFRPIRAPDHRTVVDVRAGLEHDGHAGEHVNRAVLLDVAAVLDDPPPQSPRIAARSDVHVPPDHDVAGHGGCGMNEGRLVDDGDEAFEREDVGHEPYTRAMSVAMPCPTPTHIAQSAYCLPVSLSS